MEATRDVYLEDWEVGRRRGGLGSYWRSISSGAQQVSDSVFLVFLFKTGLQRRSRGLCFLPVLE